MGQLCFSMHSVSSIKGFSVYLTRYRENAGHTIPHSPFPIPYILVALINRFRILAWHY